MTRRPALRRTAFVGVLAVVWSVALACGSGDPSSAQGGEGELGGACVLEQPDTLEVDVIDTRTHDPSIYTQGLLVHDGVVFESAGRYGVSRLIASDLDSGEHARRAPAVGDALLPGELHQLVVTDQREPFGEDVLGQIDLRQRLAAVQIAGDQA